MASSVSTSSNFSYKQSIITYTLDDFISCQSDTMICYNNLSFLDQDDDHDITYATWNVLSDYIEEVKDMCVTVELSGNELEKYRYRPKLLCNDIYSNGELFFIILIINDMYSVKQFNKNIILMPTRDNMSTITKQLYNANKLSIQEYNNTHKLSNSTS